MTAGRICKRLNDLILICIVASAAVFSGAYISTAASVPAASGHVASADGAVLRKSPSVSSAALAVMSDDTELVIYKEIFKTKKSTAKISRWYRVSAGGIRGYIRADLVDGIRYAPLKGKIRSKVRLRKGAGTRMKSAGSLAKGSKVKVCLEAKPVASAAGSSKVWYRIKYGKKSCYVCSRKVMLGGRADGAGDQRAETAAEASIFASMTDEQFDAYLREQGFPARYRKKLAALHKKHPNWCFTAYRTGMKWKDALAKQTRGKTSLVSASLPASYRGASNQAESGWYKATGSVVAYYMDPRNFLNESSICMFEDLSYRPEYQTQSAVEAVLSACRLPACGFTADIFVSAGANNKVSPVFLASRARQENGSGGRAVNGKSVLGSVYNPFNIGAFGGTDPLYNGLVYAAAKGWNTPAKAVDGGAHELAKNYINQGQNTVYYQRFNVRNGADKAGTHQYMTNIMAHYQEAQSTMRSYKSYGITDRALAFDIPVYSSMPKKTALP